MSEYLFYVHGVNTRTPDYYKPLDGAIRRDWRGGSEPITVPIYWGDLTVAAESKLRQGWQSSPIWDNLWFPGLRSTFLLQFIGDAALYISRAISAKVVERIYDTAAPFLARATPDDRLHLITHSWGTVILLDILFASRWTEPDVPNAREVAHIRDLLFAAGAHPERGVKLASITTMGSPFSLFSLMDSDFEHQPKSSHDISDEMTSLFKALYREAGVPLIWRNFIHPGDPVAYPLKPLISIFLGEAVATADVDDVGTHPGFLEGALGHLGDLSIGDAGQAHTSYWTNKQVAQAITALVNERAAQRGHAG